MSELAHLVFNSSRLASAGSLDFLIISITLSTLAIAIPSPISKCALSLALLRSNFVLFVIISILNLTKLERNSFIPISFGRPPVSAKALTP